jgi:hypothetical protein
MTDKIYQVDELVVDGIKLKIDDASATVSGLAGYENEPIVTAGSDNDAYKRKKVARIIKVKLTLQDLKQVEDLAGMNNSQISLRDTQSGQRVLFTNASFMKMGDVGQGSVDLELQGLSAPIYM